MKLLYK